MQSLASLTPSQLRRAAAVKERIENLESELTQILGLGSGPSERGSSTPRRTMSASARRKIAAAQRARWAKHRKGGNGTANGPKKTRKMSAAGRAKISAAAKARWAKVKQTGKTSLAG